LFRSAFEVQMELERIRWRKSKRKPAAALAIP
jgi:hypothetical protein